LAVHPPDYNPDQNAVKTGGTTFGLAWVHFPVIFDRYNEYQRVCCLISNKYTGWIGGFPEKPPHGIKKTTGPASFQTVEPAPTCL
jgi:hypothetical protein